MAYDTLYVDFCSSKIVVLLEDSQGKLPLRYSVEFVDQDTIRNGQIYNLENISQKIKKAVQNAAEREKIEPDKVYVGFSDPEAEYITSVGMSACGTPENPSEISHSHLKEAILNSCAVKLEEGRIIVQAIPIEFSVDSKSDIKHPIGMLAVRLEVQTGLVTVKKSSLLNYKKALEKAGFYADRFYYQPISEIFGLTNDEEKESGVLFIDIGRDLTNFGLISENKLKMVGTLPIGGIHLNKDLKFYFGISLEKAEEVKKEISRIMLPENEERETYILNTHGRKAHETTVGTIAKYFEDRLSEIFEYIKEKITREDLKRTYNIVKLTGGTSEIENIEKLAEKVFGVYSETFVPSEELENQINNWNMIFNSTLSSTIALYQYVNYEKANSISKKEGEEVVSLKNLLKRLFSK
ncbi:MAG: cell division protein FtsA [Candidatus Hydrothermia bacterium]